MRKLLLGFALVLSVSGQGVRPIDPQKSKITIYAYKAGLFSFASHDHIIAAPVSGSIDELKKTVEVELRVDDLQVIDQDESEKNKVEIRRMMLSDKLLESAKYPVITFRSTAFNQLTPDTAEVAGMLTVHGTSRAVSVKVVKSGDRYTGSTRLKQTDLGLTPISVAGGAVKVKDEVKIDFDVQPKK
jgi:polyisoprenoid-binding protein YceI